MARIFHQNTTLMKLPELPKKRKSKEADITPDITEWLLQNWVNDCVFEIKIRGKKPKPHQAIALRQVLDGQFAFKIPDMGRRNPFDGFVLKKKRVDVLVITVDGRHCNIERLNDGEEFSVVV